MKRGIIDVFVELGRRLEAFETFVGSVGSVSFGTPDACRAAQSLARDMLSREALTYWLQRYSSTKIQKNILIITAGNIPFVGVHDLLCVLAAGHRAVVRASSRDVVQMSWVVAQLIDIEPSLPVSLADGDEAFDAVVAMGGNDTVRVFREKYSDVPLLLRGTRWSPAILDGTETRAELNALADDVLAYSGLGCRNVSLVFVPRGYDFTSMQDALSQYHTSQKHRNNYRQTRALLDLADTPYIDCGTCLLRECEGFSADVSILNYAFYDSLSQVIDWLENHDDEIQCIAGFSGRVSHPRAVRLGQTQHPTLLDYPDGRDTMEFLLTI